MKEGKYYKRAKLLNPIILLLYGIACYQMVNLAQYGGIRRRAPVIIFILALLLIWFFYVFYKMKKEPWSGVIYPTPQAIPKKEKISRGYYYCAIIVFVSVTAITGYKIYQSAIPYNGKLSWYVDDFFNKKEIAFSRNNIYEDGLTGMLTAINDEIELPDELYVSDYFKVTFTETGEITDLYGFLYGKNEANEMDSFLISYDVARSDRIQVNLNGFVDATFEEERKFQPFVDGLEIIDLESSPSVFQEDELNLYYEGYREMPDGLDTVYYYDHSGLVSYIDNSTQVHAGYSFTLQAANQEIHFIYYDSDVLQKTAEKKRQQADVEADEDYIPSENIAEEFYVSEQQQYQLVILDAALGSRFYGLRKTENDGEDWTMINPDPFLGRTGVASGLTFVNESLGFIGLSHNGGTEADLFRTNDGGLTFEEVLLPSLSVQQNDTNFEPFDFPEMPFEKDGKLYLYIGQGSDGDYQSGAKALYVSVDNGLNFEFVAIE